MQTLNTTTTSSQLLTCRDVARILGQKTATIYSWCRAGKLPHLRLSRRAYRVRQSDLENFLNSVAR